MELNPNHPTTQAARDNWHKIAAIMLHKLELRGEPEMVITEADLNLWRERYPDGAIVMNDKADGIHLFLVAEPISRTLAETEPIPAPKVAPIREGLTDDPTDPRLKRGPDTEPGPQNEVYLVLSEEERAKGFTRPLRRSYRHVGVKDAPGEAVTGCGSTTTMGLALCETYAREPKFYGSTYCSYCRMHRPVGEFVWTEDGQVVGS